MTKGQVELASAALPAMVATWVWCRGLTLPEDDEWTTIQRTSLKEVGSRAVNMMKRFVRQRGRESHDLYRSYWEKLAMTEDAVLLVRNFFYVCEILRFN